MTEQPNHGQPYQQPYPYQPQGYQGPPPQQPYQNPYPQQQPYGQQPPGQFGPPGQPGQPGQFGQPQFGQPGQFGQPQFGQPGQFGQPQFGQPGQFGQPQFGQPGQPPFGQPPQGLTQPPGPKPKKKRSRWAIFFIVLFSPFIAVAFVAYAIYWVLCWLLTPVALAIHFVLCGLGLIWFSLVKVLASGGSKYRLFQPMYPKFPPFWTGAYWVRLNRRVRSTFEGLAAVAELFNW